MQNIANVQDLSEVIYLPCCVAQALDQKQREQVSCVPAEESSFHVEKAYLRQIEFFRAALV